MVKDFSWNIIPRNALLFEKTVRQYQFSISRITDLFLTHVMTRRNVRIQGWVFPLFSPDSDDRLSLNFHRFVTLYRSCDTRSVGLGQYCLPKGSNGFKSLQKSEHNSVYLSLQGGLFNMSNSQENVAPTTDGCKVLKSWHPRKITCLLRSALPSYLSAYFFGLFTEFWWVFFFVFFNPPIHFLPLYFLLPGSERRL